MRNVCNLEKKNYFSEIMSPVSLKIVLNKYIYI